MSATGIDTRALAAPMLALTRRWCVIPSHRDNAAGLREMAGELVHWLDGELGAEIVASSPELVHARLDAGRERTVVLYNMYDVMPARPEGWIVGPFAGEAAELPGIGQAFVARGAENNKGPLAGMLTVLEALADRDALPCNIELILDGEEESGSPTLRRYLADPDCPLRKAATALFPSFCEYGGAAPRLYLGFSGIAKGTMSVAGGAWGGPTKPIHSSNAPWIANPAGRLVEAIAHVLATARPLAAIGIDDEARALIASLAEVFDPEAELRFRSSRTFSLAGTPEELLAHLLSTASLNIAWLATDPARGDAVIPAHAEAGFDLRTPPGFDPEALVAEIGERLERAGMAGVEIALADAYPGHRFSRTAPGVPELVGTYARLGHPAQIWPWAPGAAPACAFARHAPSFLIAGLGRGGNAHGTNEFMALDGLPRFLASLVGWLEAVGAGKHPDT